MPACSMAAARVQLWRAPAATAAAARPPPRLHAAAAAPVPRRVHAAAIICTASARSVICSTAAGGYQRPLTNQERKAQRAAAQRLGRQLITVSLGQKGLTPTFLEGFRLAMGANALVKVRCWQWVTGSGWVVGSWGSWRRQACRQRLVQLGQFSAWWQLLRPESERPPATRLCNCPPAVQVRVGSCDESIEEVAEALGAAGDCELVHKIGGRVGWTGWEMRQWRRLQRRRRQ